MSAEIVPFRWQDRVPAEAKRYARVAWRTERSAERMRLRLMALCEIEGIDPYRPQHRPSEAILEAAWRYQLRVRLYDKLFKRMEQICFDAGMKPYWRNPAFDMKQTG